MKSVRTWLAASLAGLTIVVTAGAAHSYPDNTLIIDVGGSACSAAEIPVVVDAGDEADFVVTFDGRTRSGAGGTTFSTTFTAPTVTGTVARTLTAKATYADGTSLTASADITISDCLGAVDEDGDGDGSGLLPNTGGVDLWILVLGVGLALVGGGAAALNRRT